MRKDSKAGTATHGTLHTPSWLGLALLALWVGWTIPALASLLPGKDTDVHDAATILGLLAARDLLPERTGDAVLIRLATPCACDTNVAGATPPLPDATVFDLRAQPSDPRLPYATILLDADHALRYAGPVALASGCGRERSRPVPLAALLDADGVPIIVPEPCRCRGLNS